LSVPKEKNLKHHYETKHKGQYNCFTGQVQLQIDLTAKEGELFTGTAFVKSSHQLLMNSVLRKFSYFKTLSSSARTVTQQIEDLRINLHGKLKE
jgi:hypothetical protein